MMTTELLQRQILLILHNESNQPFLSALDEDDLAQRMKIPWTKIRHAAEYLIQKGYISSKDKQRGSRLYRTFHITPQGIDLLKGKDDNPTVSVGGDYVNITVGNNAQNLALGKGITQQQYADNTIRVAKNLDVSLDEFMEYLDSERNEFMSNEQILLLKQQIFALRKTLMKIRLV